jgi:hypothetical protein
MSDKKISQLTASTIPLAGTELLPIVQGGATVKVAVSDITAGRAVSTLSLTSTNDSTVNGITVGKGANSVTTNTAIGISALLSNTSGINNTAIGYQAGKNTTTSSTVGVTFVGSNAGAANTVGYNDGFGVGALQSVVTGSTNAAFGYGSLNKATGSGNSAFGFSALNSSVSATGNTAVGERALEANTGSYNTVIGYRAGKLLTNGANNTLIGGYQGTAGLVGNVIISDGQGNQRIAIDASGNTTIPAGNLVIGTAGKGIDTSASQPVTFNINSSEAARIHASKGVSIGNTVDPGANNLSVTGRMQTGEFNSHFFGRYGQLIPAGAANVNFLTITFPAGTYGNAEGAAIIKIPKCGIERNVNTYRGILEYYVTCSNGVVTITLNSSTGTEASLYIATTASTNTAVFSFVASASNITEHAASVDINIVASAYAQVTLAPTITML